MFTAHNRHLNNLNNQGQENGSNEKETLTTMAINFSESVTELP